jgi:signal transduction histidine kinase
MRHPPDYTLRAIRTPEMRLYDAPMPGEAQSGVLPLTLRDIALALGLTAFAQGELSIDGQAQTAAVLLSLVMTLALAARATYPLAVGLVTTGAFGLQAILLDPAPQVLGNGMAVLIATYTAAARSGPRRALPVLALAMAAFTLFEADQGDIGTAAGDMAFVIPAWAIGWAVGRHRNEVDRQLSEAADQVRSAEAGTESALAEERRMIARELHDVVSHAVTVVVLQARGGRSMLDSDPDQTREALNSIESAGLEALGEMRRLVTLLREPSQGSSPQPGLAEINALVSAARAAGAQVDLVDLGEAGSMGAGAELTAFRLVQESLTNAMRHAPGAQVTIMVNRQEDSTVIAISNPLPTSVQAADREPASSRLGLLGMRERVELYGGSLTYGPEVDRWQVLGILPSASPVASTSTDTSGIALVAALPEGT